jgi:hypothetical protein
MITPAPLTITANNASKVYGAAKSQARHLIVDFSLGSLLLGLLVFSHLPFRRLSV